MRKIDFKQLIDNLTVKADGIQVAQGPRFPKDLLKFITHQNSNGKDAEEFILLKKMLEEKGIQELKDEETLSSEFFQKIYSFILKHIDTPFAKAFCLKYEILYMLEVSTEGKRWEIFSKHISKIKERRNLETVHYILTQEFIDQNYWLYIENFTLLSRIIYLLPYKYRIQVVLENFSVITSFQQLTDILLLLPIKERQTCFKLFINKENLHDVSKAAPAILHLRESDIFELFKFSFKNSVTELKPFFSLNYRTKLNQEHAKKNEKNYYQTIKEINIESSLTDVSFSSTIYKKISEKVIDDLTLGLLRWDDLKEIPAGIPTPHLISTQEYKEESGVNFPKVISLLISQYSLDLRARWAFELSDYVSKLTNHQMKEEWYQFLWIFFVPAISSAQLVNFLIKLSYIPKPSSQAAKIIEMMEVEEVEQFVDEYLHKNPTADHLLRLVEILNMDLKITYILKYSKFLVTKQNINQAFSLLKLPLPNFEAENKPDFQSMVLKINYQHLANDLSIINYLDYDQFKFFAGRQVDYGISKELFHQLISKYFLNNADFNGFNKLITTKLWLLIHYSDYLIHNHRDLKKCFSMVRVRFDIQAEDAIPDYITTIEEAAVFLSITPQHQIFAYTLMQMITQRNQLIMDTLENSIGPPNLRKIILEFLSPTPPKKKTFKENYFHQFSILSNEEQNKIFLVNRDPVEAKRNPDLKESPPQHHCVVEATAAILEDCGLVYKTDFLYTEALPNPAENIKSIVDKDWAKIINNEALGDYNASQLNFFYFLIPTKVQDVDHAISVVLDLKTKTLYCVDPQMNTLGAMDQVDHILNLFKRDGFEIIQPPKQLSKEPQQPADDHFNCSILAVRNIVGIILKLKNIQIDVSQLKSINNPEPQWVDVETGFGLKPLSQTAMRNYKGAIYLAYAKRVSPKEAHISTPSPITLLPV